MSPVSLSEWTREDYDRAAATYCANLPLEHFMEATTQGKQREITIESLALVRARRRDFHLFNELLVQYPVNGDLGQVVPDNMIVLSEEEILAEGSYNLPIEPASPFWVLEYVSPSSERKDYEDNFHKYEHELKVPYYLLFHPEKQDLHLYRHTGHGYEDTQPNGRGRLELDELDMELGLVDGWVRYWYKGKMLPLPAELQRDLNKTRARLHKANQRAREAEVSAFKEKQRAEQEKQRAEQAEKEARRERRRSRQETDKNTQLEAENLRLRELVEELRRKKGANGSGKKS